MDIKKTVNLPNTGFPMKANLAQMEPRTLARWDAEDLYAKIGAARAGRPLYVLHDGPYIPVAVNSKIRFTAAAMISPGAPCGWRSPKAIACTPPAT